MLVDLLHGESGHIRAGPSVTQDLRVESVLLRLFDVLNGIDFAVKLVGVIVSTLGKQSLMNRRRSLKGLLVSVRLGYESILDLCDFLFLLEGSLDLTFLLVLKTLLDQKVGVSSGILRCVGLSFMLVSFRLVRLFFTHETFSGMPVFVVVLLGLHGEVGAVSR